MRYPHPAESVKRNSKPVDRAMTRDTRVRQPAGIAAPNPILVQHHPSRFSGLRQSLFCYKKPLNSRAPDRGSHSDSEVDLVGLAPQPFGKRPVEQSSSGQLATRRPRSRRWPLARRLETQKAQASAAPIGRVLRLDRARVDHFLQSIVFFGCFAFIALKAPGLDYFLTSRDHGYQLSVGSQVLMGKVPGVDVIISYGPMAMYTSSVGLWASGSLIGETVFCAAGYSVCLLLIYRLVAAYSSRTAGIVGAGFGLLLLSRFYKWYVWLIPLATLWALHRYLSSPPRQRWRWVVICGLVLGLSWLYRLDMGTTGLAASMTFLGLAEARRPPRNIVRALRTIFVLALAFSVVPIAWFGYLALKLGGAAPLDFVGKTIVAARSIAGGMAQPLGFDPIVILAYILVPATLLLGAIISLYREWAGRADPRSRFLLAVALVGLSVMHQALHRKGPVHLLQVVAPSLICAFIIYAVFKQSVTEWVLPGTRRLAYCSAGAAYFLLLVIVGCGLSRWGRPDLVNISFWPVQRYLDLARPLAAVDRFPALKLVRAIREQTGPADPILVFPLDSQLYTIAGRQDEWTPLRLPGRLLQRPPVSFGEPGVRTRRDAQGCGPTFGPEETNFRRRLGGN